METVQISASSRKWPLCSWHSKRDMELASFLWWAERVYFWFGSFFFFFFFFVSSSWSLPRTSLSPAGLGIFFLSGIWEVLGREESNSNLPGKGLHNLEVLVQYKHPCPTVFRRQVMALGLLGRQGSRNTCWDAVPSGDHSLPILSLLFTVGSSSCLSHPKTPLGQDMAL